MNNEYGYFIHTATKSHSVEPNFVHVDDLGTKTGFCSLYAVTQETATAIQQEGTTAGFKGVVWSPQLWLDFDDLKAGEEALDIVRKKEWGYAAYLSGGKGMHIGLSRPTFPSHVLPEKDKAWVKEHFPAADASIYTHLHLFRLPATVHEVTGKAKSFLDGKFGRPVELGQIERKQVSYARSANSSLGDRSVFASFRIMRSTLPATIGDRHATLVRTAYALKEGGKSAEFGFIWLTELNKWFSEPKSPEHVQQVVQSIWSR